MAMRKDIDISFSKHPLTKDLGIKVGSNAVKQSISNLVKTNFYERGFNTTLGSNVTDSLFDNLNDITINNLKDNIKQVIDNFEPMAEVIDVVVRSPEENTINISIIYNEINIPDEQLVDVVLRRTN